MTTASPKDLLRKNQGGMVHKFCNDDVGYSVVDLTDVRHVFAAAVPRKGVTIGEQTWDALRTIESVMKEESTLGSIVHQVVFLADYDKVEECRAAMHNFYGPNFPATTYVPQKPCQGGMVSIEALGVGRKRGDVAIDRRNEQLVIASHNGMSWVHCANIRPDPGIEGVYHQTLNGFRKMQRMLGTAGVDFDRIIRTWLYLGSIVEGEGDKQRYKELNRARADFFEGIRFLVNRLPVQQKTAYPASTGIGADGHHLVMSCIAIETDRPDIIAMPLENPRQTPAFGYGSQFSPKSPKFSRAMALSCGGYATIFISGTASITDSETRHIGDVERQTEETLENIAALISGDNFARHSLPDLGSSLDQLALVRVYIKRAEDYPKVRAICDRRLGEVPTIYAVADVCRPELLVEIEGIAFAQKACPDCHC